VLVDQRLSLVEIEHEVAVAIQAGDTIAPRANS
jgi:hypothetical protein